MCLFIRFLDILQTCPKVTKVYDMENFDAVAGQEDDGMDAEYTIYVNNVPPELNEVAIRDIFGQYGKIIHMYYPRNATNAKWTYITYETYREAELAIRELNDRKPLCLKVTLARRSLAKVAPANEKSQNSCVSQSLEERMLATDVAPPFAHTDVKYRQSVGRGQSMNMARKFSTMSQMISHADSESLPSSQASNIYEPEDRFENTNRFWTRGVVTVTSDGKRHVALGRGYTLYEFPEENPKVDDYIGKGSYEYGEDKFKDRLQKCYTCSIKTTKHCEKCLTYYCSRPCQVKDWPRHQMECERIPALVEETVQNMSTLQVSKEEDQEKEASKPKQAINKTIVSNDVKLRRPNIPQNSINGQSNGVTISKTERVNQLVSNAVTRDFSQQSEKPKYNSTAGNTDQSKGDEEYSINSSKVDSIRPNYNRNQNDVTNTTNNNKDIVDNNDNIKDRSYNTDKNQSFQRHEFQNSRKSPPYKGGQNAIRTYSETSSSTTSNIDDDLAFNKDTYLSNKEFTEVEVVVPLDNNEYWITKLKDIETRTTLMIQLQNVAAKSRNVKPIIGNIYGVLYEKIWHRAMIISLNPVMVHFIDYGNDEILQKDADIRDIEDMPKVPKFAKKIQLTPATAEKYKDLRYGNRLSVRMLSRNTDGTIIVEVQKPLEDLSVCTKESAPQSDVNNGAIEKTVPQEKFKMPSIINIKASKIQIPNVFDAFANLLTQKAVTELKIEGAIEIVESTETNVYSATLCPSVYSEDVVMVLTDLQQECENMKKSMNCRAQTEDLVCGKGVDAWYRGYVLTSSDLRIITVDEAKILPVNEILPCPEKFLNICAFGVVCRMNRPTIKLDEQIYTFTTLMNQENCKQGSLKIDITINDEIATAVIKPWESLITKSTPALAELKSGSKICLTSYRNQYVMFARSLNESEVEYYNDTMQRIAQCARSAPNLSEPPTTGKIVIAPFYDENNYRAMVMEVKDDKAKIAYIDFGNIDYVNIKELKVLPEDLARQRSCSAKIVLKDVPRDAPMTKETDQYLRNLTGKEIPLTCVYEGTPSTDGVHLTMPTGESVNDELNKLLIPNWKQQKDDNDERYMLNDIKVASLGNIGDTVDAFVIHIQEIGKQYMLSPLDTEMWQHIDEVMSPMIKEFCEKTEYYIPRMQELCLALYKGGWFRAVCFDPKDTDTTSQIYFLDYGNIDSVKHQNIRRMPKDFITPMAMANLCTVINLAPLDNTGNYSPTVEQKIKELVPSESLVKIKIVNCIDDGDYKVEFPDIHAKLVQGNFIK
ncbi:uncharacterized protein [Linepithema humile]|uniref:uncharacterized protein isoform X2 n=1 Tax=Linepithema humile TaxID=83485 RepID=UPI00351E8D2A